MDRSDLISLLTQAGILGKNMKTTKSYNAKMTNELRNLIEESTSYLQPNVTLYERLMNIRLNITSEPMCETCGTGLSHRIYFSKRCYHRFCNAICRHSFTTSNRVLKLNSDGGALAKAIAKKSLATQLARGSISSRIQKTLETKRLIGQITKEEDVPAFIKYKSQVYSITNKQPLHLLEHIEKRGAINSDGWHVDHQFSIREGFNQKIPPEIIGHIANLKMLPGKINVAKSSKCHITLSELKQRIKNLQNS